ncbi:MAG: 50S ribosomal protein L21 [Thermoflexales bacterium]|nr:50S ribosomal protein L21 [Thermoflexales bacterium]
MYAVIEVGTRQYRVSPGDELYVEKLDVAANSMLQFPALLISDENGVTVGKPYVEGRTVQAQVLGDVKGDKLIVFKYHPKERYRRKKGHRQVYTRIKIIG